MVIVNWYIVGGPERSRRSNCKLRAKMGTTKQIGEAGEDLAADYLAGQGYEIIKRNHRNRWGEIDIIALDHDTLVFVEVKKKSTDRFGSPGEMITPNKIKKIKDTAENYLVDNNLREVSWRIDAILLDGPHLDHLKNITA